MSAPITAPTIAYVFTDNHNTGLPQVYSEAWIVDEIGQHAFDHALENGTIIYVYNVDSDDGYGWKSVPGYGLSSRFYPTPIFL